MTWRNRRLSQGFWMDGQAIKLEMATVYSGVAGCLQLCVCVCLNDDRKREVIGRETERIWKVTTTISCNEKPEYKRVSYPLVVVGLFKSIVVVDGKWVWDSWVLKHRRGAEWKTCNVVKRVSGQTALTEMEVKNHRGRTFLSPKVKPTHLCLQPKLNVKSHVLNLNVCVCVFVHWSKTPTPITRKQPTLQKMSEQWHWAKTLPMTLA